MRALSLLARFFLAWVCTQGAFRIVGVGDDVAALEIIAALLLAMSAYLGGSWAFIYDHNRRVDRAVQSAITFLKETP